MLVTHILYSHVATITEGLMNAARQLWEALREEHVKAFGVLSALQDDILKDQLFIYYDAQKQE